MSDYIEFDIADLTIAEIEEIENLTERPFNGLFPDGQPMAKVLRAVGYIAKRREDPDFTWEQAGALKLKLNSEPDPTPAG